MADVEYDEAMFEWFEREEEETTDPMGWLEATDDDSSDDADIFKERKDDDLVPKEHRDCANVSVCGIRKHVAKLRGLHLMPVLDVFSVTLTRNTRHDASVRIHGAIKMICGRKGYYVFKRKKEDAQVFESPGEKLTLSLQGPKGLVPLLALGGFSMFFALKYNNENIVPVEPDRVVLPSYVDEDSGEEFGVEFSSWVVCGCNAILGRRVVKPVSGPVSSVDVEIQHMMHGVLARLQFQVSRDLCLYGRIIARSCHFAEGILVFEKSKDEAVEVKSGKSIPLSRSTARVKYPCSLVIHVELFDRNDNNLVLGDAVSLPSLPNGLAQQFISNGMIQLKVRWVNSGAVSPF